MNATNKIAPWLVASIGLFATGISWGAFATQIRPPLDNDGVTVSSDPATTDTGLHERLDPAGESIRAYDAGPVINGADCRLEVNNILADCVAYQRAHAQDSNTVSDRDITSTTIQRGGHRFTQTTVLER